MSIILDWLWAIHREVEGRCAVCKEVWPCAVNRVLQQLAVSRERVLALATRLTETDQRACEAEQQVIELREEAKLNASMLARQTDLARGAEAKLAVATNRITETAQGVHLAEGHSTKEIWGAKEKFADCMANWCQYQAAFLADPSQAVAQYREALARRVALARRELDGTQYRGPEHND